MNDADKQRNFEELTLRFLHQTNASKAFDYLTTPASGPHLFYLQRGHFSARKRPRKNLETVLIPNTKQLLDYYSVLQIAYLTGFIATEFSEEFCMSAIKVLNEDYVKITRLNSYRSLLPTDLLYRIENGYSESIEEDDKAISLFYQFLDVKALLEEDLELQYFLTEVCNDRSEDFEALLQTEGNFVGGQNKYLQIDDLTAVNGHTRYIEFVQLMFFLLSEAKDRAYLEAAFCNYFITAFHRENSRLESILEKTVKFSAGDFLNRKYSPDSMKSLADNLDYISTKMELYTSFGVFA